MRVGGQRNRLRRPTFLHGGAQLPGDAMRRPRAPLQERAQVTGQEGRFDGRFKENHDSSFEIQGDSKKGF